ncbi:MAG: translocation/assembly module TamB domain-containing protein, partial [Paludibacter sp.]|nr:translocation/assembly module TamB domain-containing protein [Paludibacter sp.]
TDFIKNEKSIEAHTIIHPSEIIISDSIWNLRTSDIYFYSDSLIAVNNFLFENEKQYFHINGLASNNLSDSLTVSMYDLNLDYVMQLVRLKGVSFGGLITGNMKLFSLLKEPIYLADLRAKDFSLNNKIIGDATVSSNWDQLNNQLLIRGNVVNKELENVADVTGVYVPKNDSLDLHVDAKKFPVDFLNKYFEGIASNFNGNGAGKLRIFGPTKKIRFEGDVFVTDGRATIDMLNTTYQFNDRVMLTPKKIHLNNIRIYDEEKNSAVANGSIAHNGSFANMVYDIRINTNNILAMNTTSIHDEFFYGKAYMGGLVRIFGDEQVANINVNGVSRPKTKCYMSMGNTSNVLENDFIRFVEKRLVQYFDENEDNKKEFVNQNQFNVKVDMQIEVTPEAEMEILVDPRGGDKITGRGRGNIRIRFDTFSDVELYGTIELEEGYYLFTLQTVIRKEFKVNEGSTIAWTGDPFEAQANITGYYPLTASLSDLIESEELRQITSRSTVPVHCLLYLTEDLMSPNIKFGIDLPASDESIKGRVRSIINTEEMMNRQILYLMLFHKFFTPDYMRTTAVGINEGISFATTTVSAQINNYLQNIMNSNIFSFGLDWQKTDAASDEVKAQILIQPNNRLVINGNIGYRSDNISENKFIGDFDLEYKLIESGRLRFTAYNHTIDRAQLREAKTTQGVGLIYREDFNNIGEMFQYYWDLAKGLFVKKEKEPTVSN